VASQEEAKDIDEIKDEVREANDGAKEEDMVETKDEAALKDEST